MILIQLTDLHCVAHGRKAMGRCETNMLAERALRAISAFRPVPDAVLITGDLVDGGSGPEYENFLAILDRALGRPAYVIPGNHDARPEFRRVLARLPGVADDPEFVQYTIETLPVRIIMLDTLVPGQTHGELCPARMAWLAARLAEQPARPTLIAMHHPPFFCGVNDSINLRNSGEFTALVAQHRQVVRVISGHHHRPVTAPVAHAVGSICPGVAHQMELDLARDGFSLWNLEPAAYQVHCWITQPEGTGTIVSHTAYVESFPGPFPFVADPG